MAHSYSTKKQALDLYKSGMSARQVAEHVPVSHATVTLWAREADLTRPRVEKGRRGAPVGAEHQDVKGYITIKTPAGWRLKHRVVMETQLGRPLRRSESVHHINGDRTDNRPENLQLRQGAHGRGQVLRCRSCGSHDLEPVELP